MIILMSSAVVGPNVLQGPQGFPRAPGIYGERGDVGSFGIAGPPGLRSADGKQGITGSPGAMGAMEPPGLDGAKVNTYTVNRLLLFILLV